MKNNEKILLTVLSMVLVMNSICLSAKANERAVFSQETANESVIRLLETEPDLLFEQYSNIIDIQTITLSNDRRSNEGVEIEAYEYDEDGAVHFIEAEATLTKVIYQDESALNLSGDDNRSALCVLSVNAEEKNSDGSWTKDGVTVNAVITWIDHLGVKNELVALSGSRSGSYTGDGSYICTARVTPVTSGDFEGASFKDTTAAGQTGYSFTLVVSSKSSTSGKTIQTIAKTSAFD
ncbi:MAG: hypothetical protein NC123_10375 [Butyrivibrio sp.]|nr:hypothetical protein [Acetatifactor muris]MCM1559934.1 hypothetical protein [Butyrivibrio sp.]